MADHYKLVGKEAVPCELMEWATTFSETDRHVALTMVGDVKISTVFLGLNHAYGNGDPLLFETMVFGGPLDQEMNRYTTWEEAELGHTVMVKAVEEARQKSMEGVALQPATAAVCHAENAAE